MTATRPDDRDDTGWLESVSGVPFWPLDLREGDRMPLVDLASALANLCRYGGHVWPLYSVAQHSVLVAEYVERQIRAARWWFPDPARVVLAALLHDLTEGLGLVDLPRPVKYAMPQYLEAEARAEAWVRFRWALDLPSTAWELIKQGDDAMLATEKRDLKPHGKRDWRLAREAVPAPYRVTPWTPEQARARFLWKWWQVTRPSFLRQ